LKTKNIEQTLIQDISNILRDNNIIIPEFKIEIPKKQITKKEYSTNVAMVLSKNIKKSPIDAAEYLKNLLYKSTIIKKNSIEILKPGFINFDIDDSIYYDNLLIANKNLDNYIKSNLKMNFKSINIEYVSGNPTGYLHVGHLRHAIVGSILVNLFKSINIEACSSYYINDAGSQMTNLAKSVYCRILELNKKVFYENDLLYKGDEIITCAEKYLLSNKQITFQSKFDDLPSNIKHDIQEFSEFFFLDEIKKDLELLGITYDEWISEKSLIENSDQLISELLNKNLAYKKDGAIFAKTTDDRFKKYKDDKDRVLKKKTGEFTYIVPDVLGHIYKFNNIFTKQGTPYEKQVDIFGADHHGYIPRLKCLLEMSNQDVDKLDFVLVQLVKIIKGNVEVKMSKRSGTSFYLRDLINYLGNNISRFVICSNLITTQLDFDIEKLKNEKSDGSFYYVLNAYEKCVKLLKNQHISNISRNKKLSVFEKNIISDISQFPIILAKSATLLEPNFIFQYLTNLARKFHIYYDNEKILSEDKEDFSTKLLIIETILILFKKIFNILGLNIEQGINRGKNTK